jgi:hypothetical protein
MTARKSNKNNQARGGQRGDKYMTKYSNVVINGKTLEVPAQSAVKYEQVGEIGEGNSANIEAGDVIVYEDAPFSWITVGSAYVVTEIDSDKDARIMDDEGDNYDTCGDVFTTYRKVSEKKRLTVGDYAKVVARVSCHNYEIGTLIEIVTDATDHQPYKGKRPDGTRGNWLFECELEPATKAEFDAQIPKAVPEEYTEVRRQARVGERIRIVKTADPRWENGEEFVVKRTTPVGVGFVHPCGFCDGEATAFHSEYVVLEPKPTDPRSQFATGDKVRLLSGGGCHPLNGYADGKEYTVTNPLYSGHRGERIEITGGGQQTGYAKPDQLVKVTEKATVRLKVGEYGKVQNYSGDLNGKIVKVTKNDRVSVCGFIYGTEKLNGEPADVLSVGQLVRATAEEVAAARYAAKIGDFKDGDWAEIVNPTEENADSSVIRAKGQTVKVVPCGPSGYRGLTLTSADGSLIGFANADALRKVDAPKSETKHEDRVPVGSYVKIMTNSEGLTKGDIAKVTEDDSDDSFYPYRCELLDRSNFDWFRADQFEVIPEAEVAEAVESAKWSAIGRNVNEYKTGDIVEVTGGYEEVKRGDIGVITNADGSSLPGVTVRGVQRYVQVKLVMPVEQRFDKVS